MKRVHIISARSNYEGMYPMDTSKWKLEAFFAIGKTYSDKVSLSLTRIRLISFASAIAISKWKQLKC